MPLANELSLFALVVEARSFSKAADMAAMSTPALSKKISKLESILGVQLLYRTTRRLSLTEAGKLLYDHSKGINRQVNNAIDSVSNFSKELTGTIKMTVPTISGELLLAGSVAEFAQQHPRLNIDMRLENNFVDLVQDGIDLAIRTGVLEDSSLIAKKLIQSNWVVCCSPDYLKDHGEPQSLRDLDKHNCLAYTFQGEGANEWRFTMGNKQLAVNVSGNFSSNNAQALRKAALSHVGLVYVPRCSVYEDLQAKQLVTVLHEFKPRSLGVYAVYPYTRHQPEKISRLIEHISKAYEERREYF